jgi:hypothetical protein
LPFTRLLLSCDHTAISTARVSWYNKTTLTISPRRRIVMRVCGSISVGIIRVQVIGVVTVHSDVLITGDIVKLSAIDLDVASVGEEWHASHGSGW